MPSNVLCIPFADQMAGIDSIGVLCLLDRKTSSYQDQEIQILVDALHFVAILINNSQLSTLASQADQYRNDNVLNELKKSKILLDFAISLYQEDNLSKLMEKIILRARDLLSADKASVFVVDKQRKEVIKL